MKIIPVVCAISLLGSVATAQACDWVAGPGVSGVTRIEGLEGTVNATLMWDPDGAGPTPARLVVGGVFQAAG